MRKLDDAQVEAFDTEYVTDARWCAVKANIDRDFPGGDFTFLDVGGGNGKFADRLLAAYPHSKGTVLDNSELLLARNQVNARKTIILDAVENIGRFDIRFDIIFLNWLLHHVVGETYSETRKNQRWTLRAATALLSGRGRISVFENLYDGLLIDGLPAWAIYQLTSSQNIKGITRRLGANTAAVGVCFLSKKRWLSTFDDAGLEVLGCAEPDEWIWSLPLAWKFCLHTGRRSVGLFWLSAPKSP